MTIALRSIGLILAASAAFALPGCKPEPATENQKVTGAALLPRSVGDDMPPYDTVRSQSPRQTHGAPGAEDLDNPRPIATSDTAASDADAAVVAAEEVNAAVERTAN